MVFDGVNHYDALLPRNGPPARVHAPYLVRSRDPADPDECRLTRSEHRDVLERCIRDGESERLTRGIEVRVPEKNREFVVTHVRATHARSIQRGTRTRAPVSRVHPERRGTALLYKGYTNGAITHHGSQGSHAGASAASSRQNVHAPLIRHLRHADASHSAHQ